MSGVMTVSGYVFITLSLMFICYKLFVALRSKSRVMALLSAIYIITALYPLGLGSKMALVGPDFLRWHIADIGFPVMVGLVFLRSRGYNPNVTWRTIQQRIGFGLLISYTYEIAVGRIIASLEGDVPHIGGFDWLDMAAYTIGAGLAIALCQPLYTTELKLASARAEATRAEDARNRELRNEQKKAAARTQTSKHGRKRSRKRRQP